MPVPPIFLIDVYFFVHTFFFLFFSFLEQSMTAVLPSTSAVSTTASEDAEEKLRLQKGGDHPHVVQETFFF